MSGQSNQSFGLTASVIEQIKKVFSRYPNVERVLIYGSRAKGDYHTGSDIDLALIGEKATLEDTLAIEHELDDLLLPYKIDVAIYHEIDNPNLIDHIDRVGTEIFSK